MFRRILLPTDFSGTSDAALDYACELTRRFGSTLHLLHVIEEAPLGGSAGTDSWAADGPGIRGAMLSDAQERLAHRTRELASNGAVRSEVIFGRPAETIVEYAAEQHADLIVMGTHGRTGVAHLLLGSVAEKVMRLAPCPVLTVRERRYGRESVLAPAAALA